MNELYHYGVKAKRKNARYVARIETGKKFPKYRYFYDMEEYKAYLRGDDPKAEETGKKRIVKQEFQPTRTVGKADETTRNKALAKADEVAKKRSLGNPKDLVNDGKHAVEDIVENAKVKTKESLKQKVDKGFEKVAKTIEESPDTLNKVVDKVKDFANKIYEDPDNIYDVNASSYDKKIKKIQKTDEWRAIVERRDPEYVRRNADGTTSYLIDDYLVKKKRPLLDIVDDIANNRSITVNKIEKDSIVAGLKQQVFGKITLGMIAVGAAAKVLTTTAKLSQGTYKNEINNVYNNIDTGMKKVEEFTQVAQGISEQDINKVLKVIETTRQATDVEKITRRVNEDDIVTAAKIIMQSDNIPDAVSANEYYQQAESILTNLSEEEIVMLNVLINSMRNQK